jgi:hypothetical protein
MKKLLMAATVIFLSGCSVMTVSETEACWQITKEANEVSLSRQDTSETIQVVGELLYVIEAVCPRKE